MTHPLYLPLAVFFSSALPLLDTHLTLLQFFPSPWLPTAIQLPSLSLQSAMNQTLNCLPALVEGHSIKNKRSFSDSYFRDDLFWLFLFESLISVIPLCSDLDYRQPSRSAWTVPSWRHDKRSAYSRVVWSRSRLYIRPSTCSLMDTKSSKPRFSIIFKLNDLIG